MYLILRSNYLLAENSVPEKRTERYQSTLDEYYSFVAEFPVSKYTKDVEKMYKVTFDNSGKLETLEAAKLMRDGLELRFETEPRSELLLFEAVP